MQVESIPVSTPLPEAPLPQPIVPSSESSEITNVPLPPISDDTEQPTFHIMQPPPPATIAPNELAIAPAPPTYTQLIAVPITSDQTITPTIQTTTATIKQTKRGSRSSHNNKQITRSPAKPATLLARPSTGKTSTILPQPQKTVVLGNQMTPLIPKPVSTTNVPVIKPSATNQSQGFTTYLVVDGNQGQLVQVANDGQKPITFRNQSGQILQATPITVVSAANQPVIPSFQTNGDSSILSNSSQINTFQQPTVTPLTTQQSHQNSSQTVTTVRTSSTIDMQRTTLTSDTTTMTTQQLTGITQLPATASLINGCNIVTHQPSLLQPNPILPTSILNGNSIQSHGRDLSPIHNENDSSLDDISALDGSTTPDLGLSLSLSQIARKANHRHRRSSSSSLSKKKRGRPRLYERDPFTNKPIKSRPMPEGTELTIPNVTATTTTLLIPGQTTTTTFNNIHPHTNGGTSLIFPSQPINHTTTIPVNNPSLLQQQQQQQQQQQYSYPSLLNSNASSTNMLAAPTLNIFAVNNNNNHNNNNNNHNNNISSCTSSYSYTSQPTTILPPPSTNTISRSFIPPITQTIENQATIPLKNLQISSTSSPTTSSPRSSTIASTSTTVPNVVQLNPSPIKSLNQTQNNDIVVHYIGGFVIRESSHPFPIDDNNDNSKELNNSHGKEKENHSFNDNNSDLGSDQLRCILCKKVDFSERFYNQEKKFCSKSCSTKSSKIIKTTNGKNLDHIKTPPINEPIRIIENSISQQTIETNIDEQISLPPDHGLPADPSKWTVYQVGEFIARLTNNTIREAFYESEMDGQALLLMTQEHLRDTMKIKLGPSLIISSEIAKLRERARTFSS
ncbi:unnamed protein product [Rotaria sordida]|uniref:Uncharacterized protein n=1 Tax=Rotaria sordida TaxID=392033 RepID=A0A818VH48_9BILA|nr:unnamed protein product [Rotaria sordida]CAF3708776.1 unnamed protein product [Rotaria sordida]